MAPLYKRYIPPKTAKADPTPRRAIPEPILKSEPTATSDDVAKKRKRERTEEEIAERKAKKLRKKGIDPATVEQESKLRNDGSKQPVKATDQVARRGSGVEPIGKPQGEFAHVKNVKKRHKLEKEARKAKKAAVPNGESDGVGNGQQRPDSEDELAPLRTPEGDLRSQPADYDGDISNKRQTRLREDAEDRSNLDNVEQVRTGAQNRDMKVQQEKKKKKKTAKHGKDEVSAADANAVVDRNIPREDGYDQAASQPKKRRHKLESILEKARNESPNQSPEAEDHLLKHSGIMKRFAQSKSGSKMATTSFREAEQPEHATVVLNLTPLPQPKQVAMPEFRPDPSSVPKWLAEPTIVSGIAKSRFDELQFHPKLVQQLSGLGFTEAMPVQQALIPLLLPSDVSGAKFLPGTEPALPDIAVGAPTGSGKTIAYLVPIIQSLKATVEQGKMKALVVVPTRELVMQVAAIAESLARGSSIKIGMATGMGSFKDEQVRLISCGRRYDPAAHRQLIAKAHRRNYPPAEGSEDFEEHLTELENQDVREEKRIQDAASILVDHVPTYMSAVDILIATPGRLLEHIDKTLGFSLAHLDWLILDEADKLVDQQYDGFLDNVNQVLSQPRQLEEQDARERFLRAQGFWEERKERRVRKVVLSATMTRDISKLMELKLKNPQLILVQSDVGGDVSKALDAEGEVKAQRTSTYEFELPPALVEYCVHVGDGSEKPLYFVELVDTKIIGKARAVHPMVSHAAETLEDSHRVDLASNSSGRSILSSEDDTSSSESSEKEEQEGATATVKALRPSGMTSPQQEEEDVTMEDPLTVHPDRAALLEHFSIRRAPTTITPVILVFVSSTESANRLAHLLAILKPEWASYIRALTRSDSGKALSHATHSYDPIIAVSTDRAARGLDAIANKAITHVVQYDIPRSATGYIHRVGRTARAGRRGEAWTLYTHSEARWFYKGICKADSIKRAEPVEKVKIALEDDEMRDRLAHALEGMRKHVFGPERGPGK